MCMIFFLNSNSSHVITFSFAQIYMVKSTTDPNQLGISNEADRALTIRLANRLRVEQIPILCWAKNSLIKNHMLRKS